MHEEKNNKIIGINIFYFFVFMNICQKFCECVARQPRNLSALNLFLAVLLQLQFEIFIW